jgi:hypothetical protein
LATSKTKQHWAELNQNAGMRPSSTSVFTPAIALAAAMGLNPPLAAAELHCQLIRGTEVIQLTQKSTSDPYGVALVPAGPGFEFKALVLEQHRQVSHVMIHAYYLRDQVPTLLHQAIYTRPPLPSADLTGEQVVIEPVLGRDLRYRCALLEGQP